MTLVLARAVNLHSYYKKHLEEIGFKNIFITDIDRDALLMVIYEKKPELVMIEACFYRYSTPYMMFELLEKFPKLNIAIINLYDFPDEKAKWFILNGVNSYVSMLDGVDEFFNGLINIKDRSKYISPNVMKCINNMCEIPEHTSHITLRENEILELLCDGLKECEIANNLNISVNTVHRHRQSLFNVFNVENKMQLFRAALDAGKVKKYKIIYFN